MGVVRDDAPVERAGRVRAVRDVVAVLGLVAARGAVPVGLLAVVSHRVRRPLGHVVFRPHAASLTVGTTSRHLRPLARMRSGMPAFRLALLSVPKMDRIVGVSRGGEAALQVGRGRRPAVDLVEVLELPQDQVGSRPRRALVAGGVSGQPARAVLPKCLADEGRGRGELELRLVVGRCQAVAADVSRQGSEQPAADVTLDPGLRLVAGDGAVVAMAGDDRDQGLLVVVI